MIFQFKVTLSSFACSICIANYMCKVFLKTNHIKNNRICFFENHYNSYWQFCIIIRLRATERKRSILLPSYNKILFSVYRSCYNLLKLFRFFKLDTLLKISYKSRASTHDCYVIYDQNQFTHFFSKIIPDLLLFNYWNDNKVCTRT